MIISEICLLAICDSVSHLDAVAWKAADAVITSFVIVIVWLWPATEGPGGCSAAPPPAVVRRRIERNRQKLVGQDKGSLTEQQTKGKNSNNNDTDKENTQNKIARREQLSPTAATAARS